MGASIGKSSSRLVIVSGESVSVPDLGGNPQQVPSRISPNVTHPWDSTAILEPIGPIVGCFASLGGSWTMHLALALSPTNSPVHLEAPPGGLRWRVPESAGYLRHLFLA